MPIKKTQTTEDDIKEPISHLVKNRLPWLILGLIGGLVTSVVVSHFEKILESDIRLSFFIPVIVYMSDAVGTQTETIYVRHLEKKTLDFWKYFFKEISLGMALGIIFGLATGVFAFLWLGSSTIAFTIGLAMLVNVALAPLLAIIFPVILYRDHLDPALGAGPLGTVAQDFVSLMVYFLIASLIIL